VGASSGFTRLFIRGLAWDAEEKGVSFCEALKCAARAKLTDTAKGKVLSGTTAGGSSVTFSLPPLNGLSAVDIAEVCSLLLDRVDSILAKVPGASDAELQTALLASVVPVRSIPLNFTGLRL
jgi:hypothetical protein